MSADNNVDRFDLEQAIMTCWNTADDLDMLAESVLEAGLDEDELANALTGLKQLHHLRMSRLFRIFERLLETRQFAAPADAYENEDDEDYEDED